MIIINHEYIDINNHHGHCFLYCHRIPPYSASSSYLRHIPDISHLSYLSSLSQDSFLLFSHPTSSIQLSCVFNRKQYVCLCLAATSASSAPGSSTTLPASATAAAPTDPTVTPVVSTVMSMAEFRYRNSFISVCMIHSLPYSCINVKLFIFFASLSSPCIHCITDSSFCSG